ncbi:MAG: type III pantothenate kinase [Bacteroidota bacterium]|nr:type III pantothenate kinase [Bacteroidota bacterium]
MQLVIDLGNTNLKAGIFSDSVLKRKNNFAELARPVLLFPQVDPETLQEILNKNPEIDSCILSSVIEYPRSVDTFLSKRLKYIRFSSRTPVPVKNHYQSPHTLGNDRIASAVAAHTLFPNSAALVITMGTCITYDLVTRNGEYKGGGISPGMQMRFSSLHTFTSQLPLIEYTPGLQIPVPGTDTRGSMISGVIHGIIAEIEGISALYKKVYPSIQVILSGGDMNYFANRLKINIFVHPNLVIYGLQKILEFNV